MITAALDGKLDDVEWKDYGYFQLCIPASCPGVPTEVLNPENTWADKKHIILRLQNWCISSLKMCSALKVKFRMKS